MRNCKWVDEVVEDAPWTVTQDFIDKHRIDYIAHDEEPYQSAGSDDIYKFVKDQGKFLPTRRTSGISTSELLQRIVENYRLGCVEPCVRFVLRLVTPHTASDRASCPD